MIKSEVFLVDYRKRIVLQSTFSDDHEIAVKNNLYNQKRISWRYMNNMELKVFFNQRSIEQIISRFGVNKQKYSIN